MLKLNIPNSENYCKNFLAILNSPELWHKNSQKIPQEFFVQTLISKILVVAREIAIGKQPFEGSCSLWHQIDERAIVEKFADRFEKPFGSVEYVKYLTYPELVSFFKDNSFESILISYLIKLNIPISIRNASDDDGAFAITIEEDKFKSYVEERY